MTFERKIAGQGLAEVKAPSIAPTGDQKGGTWTVSGGALSAADRGHKNWGQTINQGFELRSLMGTAMFKNLDTAPGTFELDLGAFGYYTVRSSGPTLAVSLAKPDGVPTSQHTVVTPPATPAFRHRQRWGFLEVYYPEDTTVTFSADFAFGTAAYKPLFWEQPDLALLVGEDSPITYAQLTKDILPQRLDELLAEGPRLANTSDLFLVSYNERTGKATVFLLSGPAGMEGMDPEVPVPDTTTPVDDINEPTTPTRKPWDPKNPKPVGLDPDTQHDYVDPVTGLPLVPTPPPAGAGTLYALHGDGVSVSTDGGATWAPVNISGAGTLIDIVATTAGLFVLDDEGRVFTAATIADPFQLVAIGEKSTPSIEIPVVNGDFETGDLTGWTSAGLEPPRVLRTTQPRQRPGSTYYLTRDWRVVTQPFSLVQSVAMPAGVANATGSIAAFVDAYADSGDVARLELLDGTETIVANTTFTTVRTGSNFRANGFAVSPTQGPLNLVGTGTPVVGSFINESLPVWLDGNSGQAVSANIAWRVEKADGSLYDGFVVLRVFDVDAPEKLTVAGIVDFDLLASDVSATVLSAGTVRFDGGASDGVTSDVPIARIHITVGPEFSFAISGISQAAVGLKGPGSGAAPAPVVLASAESSAAEWQTLTAAYSGPIPSKLAVRLTGGAPGGLADAYFDNVRLTAGQPAQAPQVLAMASVEGDQGGAELYLDGGILRYVVDPAERGATVPVPAANITMADHDPESSRVASNGTTAWAWGDGDWGAPISGPFSSILADPIPVLVKTDGDVLDAGYFGAPGGVMFSLGDGDWHVTGDRRRQAYLFTESATGALAFSVLEDSTITSDTILAQPVAPAAAERRSVATDSGRLFGWSVGSRDIFWTSELTVAWSVAGALGAPIIKLVELR